MTEITAHHGLVLHGDADASVLFEGSGARTYAAIPGSQLYVIAGACRPFR
jgi:hypothetical protein